MKFDLDTAWKDASTLLRDNLRLLALIAGVFHFIPYLAAMLWIPGLAEISERGLAPNDPATQAKFVAMLGGYWWAILLGVLLHGAGLIAMLALLRRRPNPTVAEAIQIGVKLALTYLLAFILTFGLLGFAARLLLMIAAITGVAAIVWLGAFASIGLGFYLLTKFSLSSAIIGIEGQRNPISALSKSWHMTKGHSLRLFFYFALLFLAYLVISMIISLVLSLVFALGGADTQTFGKAVSASLMNGVLVVIFAGVLAAVHAQLTRLSAPPPPVDQQV